MDSYLIADSVLVTLTVVIFVIVALLTVYRIFFRAKPKAETFLLLGICDAGKTAMFSKMLYKKPVQTHTSMKENEAVCHLFVNLLGDLEPLTRELIHLVDVPGHERLRHKFTEFAPVARGIVFVVDSSTCKKNVRAIAEYLYDVLSNKHVIKKKVPIQIACNKNDLLNALSADHIQKLLESEIDRLRSTRTAALEHQDAADEEVEYLGYDGESFEFDHVENKVEFASCSVETEKFEVVKEWISDIAAGYG